jgi:hypothetical protein
MWWSHSLKVRIDHAGKAGYRKDCWGKSPEIIALAQRDPMTCQGTFEIVVKTTTDPSTLGMATHLLYMGKKSLEK